MAKLIDTHTGDKVDCFLLDDDPINRTAFSRRAVKSTMGMHLALASAEDTILAKLRWSEMAGGSSQQQSDVREIFRYQKERLDMSYLRTQAARMGLGPVVADFIAEMGANDDSC